MSDLEEMGYIIQPYTSAGRIPSDAGYRFYIDDMMKEKQQELDIREEELNKKEELLIEKVDRVEELLQNVAKTLAANTNYATMVAAPAKRGRTIKFIQISQLEKGKILAVLVLEGNTIKNTIIENDTPLDTEACLKLNILLNTSVNGLTLEEINLAIISKMTSQAGEYGMLIRDILDAVAVTASSGDDLQIYTSGAMNILKYPELSDNSKASELIYTLEEKKTLTNLINDSLDEDNDGDIKVYIGEETPVDSMKDCSVVTATYELKDGAKGTIGIIGPKRMDYEKVVRTMKNIKTQLDDAFKN
jgi:heat-inducible transcriptional repressor